MPFPSPRLQCATVAASNAAMSSRSNFRGRSSWRRGLCDRTTSKHQEEDEEVVSGDSHLTAVSDANYGRRRGHVWEPRGSYQDGPRRPPFRPQAAPPGSRPPPPSGFYRHPPPSGFYRHPPPSGFYPLPRALNPPPPGFRPGQQGFHPPPPNGIPHRSPGFRPAHPGYYPSQYGIRNPTQGFRPPPRPRLADYRSWVASPSQPPPECERFKVLSYNILADYLARDDRSKFYFHIPQHILNWEWRKRRILIEFGLWSPDIMCLQEVDRFQDLEQELSTQGYNGVWKMRTGTAVDGCAMFWRANRFQLQHEEYIEYNKLGLRDNVAQICVLESRNQRPVQFNATASFSSSSPSRETNQVVVCNIHVLYNPKRGEVKLGQVRVLIDRAYSVSRLWNDAPVIICGDFNSTPRSPLYNFILEQKLNVSGLARNQVSGQYSASILANQGYSGYKLHGVGLPQQNSVEVVNDGQINLTADIPNDYKPLNDESNISPLPFRLARSADLFGESDCSSLYKNESSEFSDFTNKDMHVLVNSSAHHSDTISVTNLSDEIAEICNDWEVSLSMQGTSTLEHTHPPVSNDDVDAREVESHHQLLQKDVDAEASDSFGEASTERRELPLESLNPSCEMNDSSHFVMRSASFETMEHVEEHGIRNDKLCDVTQAFPERTLNKCTNAEANSNNEEKETVIFNSDACPEETSDLSFLAELHGLKDINDLNEEVEHVDSDHFDQTMLGPSSDRVQNYIYNPFQWTPMEIATASGDADCSVLQHDLNLKSAYAEVRNIADTRDSNGEPQVTSYNRAFMGTVDYIWFSDGIQPVKVLDTIRKEVLQQTPGFPTPKWGSDHLALVCEFAFSESPVQV